MSLEMIGGCLGITAAQTAFAMQLSNAIPDTHNDIYETFVLHSGATSYKDSINGDILEKVTEVVNLSLTRTFYVATAAGAIPYAIPVIILGLLLFPPFGICVWFVFRKRKMKKAVPQPQPQPDPKVKEMSSAPTNPWSPSYMRQKMNEPSDPVQYTQAAELADSYFADNPLTAPTVAHVRPHEMSSSPPATLFTSGQRAERPQLEPIDWWPDWVPAPGTRDV